MFAILFDFALIFSPPHGKPDDGIFFTLKTDRREPQRMQILTAGHGVIELWFFFSSRATTPPDYLNADHVCATRICCGSRTGSWKSEPPLVSFHVLFARRLVCLYVCSLLKESLLRTWDERYVSKRKNCVDIHRRCTLMRFRSHSRMEKCFATMEFCTTKI